jgi:hypothetical protein
MLLRFGSSVERAPACFTERFPSGERSYKREVEGSIPSRSAIVGSAARYCGPHSVGWVIMGGYLEDGFVLWLGAMAKCPCERLAGPWVAGQGERLNVAIEDGLAFRLLHY